jgi:hypothetical protein
VTPAADICQVQFGRRISQAKSEPVGREWVSDYLFVDAKRVMPKIKMNFASPN